jgi:hypothetical protein
LNNLPKQFHLYLYVELFYSSFDDIIKKLYTFLYILKGVNGDWDSTYAKRDIVEGEELLDDYGVYDHPEWLISLYQEYEVPNDFVVNKILDKTPIVSSEM